jgi:LysM repeat protein
MLVRLGAPAALLAAATAAILLVRAGLDGKAEATHQARAGGVAAAVISQPAPRSAKPAARRRFYTIRAGDTLGAVADRLGSSVEHLLALNPGVRPTSLRIGQRIRTG